MHIFCERVNELRIEHNLTQNKLEEKLQTTNSSVCDWEKGRSQPDLKTLANMAQLFQVSVDYLLGLKED